ncbi:cytochrome subunit of sulfide dehydrogenase precursor [mine drainage metagenome]|uniref:Cytochrome subunit of sulfide dehydrogenase n=1 Tax=mine drainage metagenome TaxID=410659 RepID=A0A1J5QEX7_9ZZZZ
MKLRYLLLAYLALPAMAGADAHIRTLAASCAACHGTNGNSVGGTPVLAGLDRNYFITQMQAFRSGTRASTVMHHHAMGLPEDEIEQLGDYFAAQKRVAVSSPMPLKGF